MVKWRRLWRSGGGYSEVVAVMVKWRGYGEVAAVMVKWRRL